MKATLAQLSSLVCVTLMIASCGQKDQNTTDKTETAPIQTQPEAVSQQSEAEEAAAQLTVPASVIVRIPVDQDGNITGEPEMRSVNESLDVDNSQLIAETFDAATAAASVSTEGELDADSSTQSWFLRRARWGYGRWGGWGGWGARLGWRGGYYGYGFSRGYYWGGYRYGCFNRYYW